MILMTEEYNSIEKVKEALLHICQAVTTLSHITEKNAEEQKQINIAFVEQIDEIEERLTAVEKRMFWSK